MVYWDAGLNDYINVIVLFAGVLCMTIVFVWMEHRRFERRRQWEFMVRNRSPLYRDGAKVIAFRLRS